MTVPALIGARSRRLKSYKRKAKAEAIRVPLLDIQYAFLTCVVRFCALVTGVGYGKTWIGARKAVSLALKYPGTIGLACANSYRQLEDVVEPELEAALEAMGVGYTWQSGKSRFVLANGSKILCRSLDKTAVSKIRGTAFLWAWLDEARDMPEKAFKVVMGRVGRKRGPAAQVFITTTPNGFNWIYKYFGPNRKNRADFEIFKARTADNPTLPPSYFESLADSYDSRFAAQELDGDFIAAEDVLYGAFSKKNISRLARYQPGEPINVALDFNFNPCVAAIIQEIAGRTCVVDEIWVEGGASAPGVIDEFMARYPRARDVTIYGDPAGHGRSAQTGKSYYDLWREALPHARIAVPRSVYPIVDRVNSVNYRLKTARTKTRLLYVNPGCEHAIEDFSQVLPAKDGSLAPRKSADTPELTHISDAIGYYVVHEHSVRARVDRLKAAAEDAAHRHERR